MPLQATSGAASYDAFGGGVAVVPNYIEDVFSTWLYTGNDSTQPITNGIDLAGKGGAVFIKKRAANFGSNAGTAVLSTDLGNNVLLTHVTNALQSYPGTFIFGSSGFNPNTSWTTTNQEGDTYASWTFRKQPKFFDVVTYTGSQNSSGTGQTVSHNLGSTPGCIIIKPLSDTSGTGFTLNDWIVYHRGLSSPTTQFLRLNTTAAIDGNSDKVRAVSDTTFTAGWEVGLNGIQYVAYVFAHNAGGFGLTGTDNVISCGSYTGTGSPVDVNLGYEAQWVLIKRTDGTGNWYLMDTMRGMSMTNALWLYPNLSSAEVDPASAQCNPTATGFTISSSGSGLNAGGGTYIYIAIRRGPMKVPTTGTSVFNPSFNGQTSTDYLAYLGQPTDFWIRNDRAGSDHNARSRLTGGNSLLTNSTAAETTSSLNWWDNQLGVGLTGSTFGYNDTIINYLFRRAPGFMDVCCYTGTGSARTVAHNLAAVPELMIVKSRSAPADWPVYAGALGATKALNLNLTFGEDVFSGWWNNTSPTSTQFTVGVNSSSTGVTYVAYLFASCPGVSRVGSYTGNGSSQTIDCGFTGGARFVLIKRTDSTGDWYVWDSARGIVSGNDPYLLLNSTAAEVTSTDYVDTYSAGFEISSTAPSAINASGGNFLFMAIA